MQTCSNGTRLMYVQLNDIVLVTKFRSLDAQENMMLLHIPIGDRTTYFGISLMTSIAQ
jgi:hypothetical protein